jgi:hypothetical protein
MQPATRHTTAAFNARTVPAGGAVTALCACPNPYPPNNHSSEAQADSGQRLERHAPTRRLPTVEVSAVETGSRSMWIYTQPEPLLIHMEICKCSGYIVPSNWL